MRLVCRCLLSVGVCRYKLTRARVSCPARRNWPSLWPQRAGQLRAGEVGAGKVRARQVGVGEVGAGQHGCGEVRAGEPGRDGGGEVRRRRRRPGSVACRPRGFNLDTDRGVLEIGAHDLPDRRQKRLYMIHIRANPYVAFVVDDLVTEPTWAPRGVSVRGRARIHPEGGERLAPGFGPIWVEIIPESISAWGIDTSAYEPPNSRKMVTP